MAFIPCILDRQRTRVKPEHISSVEEEGKCQFIPSDICSSVSLGTDALLCGFLISVFRATSF